jgi:hypothetical protein
MSISSVSPSVAATPPLPAATKSPASVAAQLAKPTTPAATVPADADGDRDGSGGGINVKA